MFDVASPSRAGAYTALSDNLGYIDRPVVTPHAQRERGKVIGVGVHVYMFVDQKKI